MKCFEWICLVGLSTLLLGCAVPSPALRWDERMSFSAPRQFGPTQYVVVTFPDKRDVYIDGKKTGSTGDLLAIRESGTYAFTLGEPVDYQPSRIEIFVNGTTVQKPWEVKFEKL